MCLSLTATLPPFPKSDYYYYSPKKKPKSTSSDVPKRTNTSKLDITQHRTAAHMFGLGKTTSTTQMTYFDVRVKSTYKNLVIVRGSQYDSPSVMLSGDVVFSLSEDITVKKVGLRLIGRYKLDFLEVLSQDNTTVSNPVKEESIVFEVNWDNLLLKANGVMGPPEHSNSGTITPTRRLIRTNTPMSLNVPIQGVSGTPFEDMVIPNGTSFVLSGGNYELPFKCILPGDIPETVEGLMAGSILYKFEAVFDRGGFKSPLMRYKYFRIFRTLSSDNFSISETISIGKSWPNKIQYEVSIPSRAVAIGDITPIKILLVPLCKGLKLGAIRAQLIQYYAFKGYAGDIYDDEQIALDCTMSQMESKLLDDQISIDSFIKIPSNLKKVTQDCDLKGDIIKVRHKLKLQINLVNKNGHTSELRTNIPITLFISPNVEMSGRTIILDKHGKIHFRKDEEKLFDTAGRQASQSTTQRQSNPQRAGGDAPPNYEEHVYDRMIFNEGRTDAPVYSGVSTPLPTLSHHAANSHADYFGFTPRSASPTLVPGSMIHATAAATASVTCASTVRQQQEHTDGPPLAFGNISNVPSYQDAVDGSDVPNPSEEFAPNYAGMLTGRGERRC